MITFECLERCMELLKHRDFVFVINESRIFVVHYVLDDLVVKQIGHIGEDTDEVKDALQKISVACGVPVEQLINQLRLIELREQFEQDIMEYKANMMNYLSHIPREPKAPQEPAPPYKSKIKYCKGYKPKQYWNRTRAKLNFKTNKKWKNRK